MPLTNLFYRSPRLLALTLLLILTAGSSALMSLPRAEDPTLSQRNATVFTAFPGADAERVEALVTEVLEDALAEFEEIKEIKSISRAGLSTVAIELNDDEYLVDEIWARMRDDLEAARGDLPLTSGSPDLVEFELAAFTLMVGLTWTAEAPVERAVLGRLSEDVADQLRSVPGTSDVGIYGEPDEEVLVDLDPGRAAALGLDAASIAATLLRRDAKVGAGEVTGGANNLQVEVSGEFESLDGIRNAIVDQDRAGGSFVRLGDVASVRKAERQPREAAALIDGQPGVVIAARMETGRRVDTWSEAAQEVAAEAIAALPAGVKGEVLFDQARYTKERLGSLVVNFLMGAGLVMLVILFTMGWRSALVVGTALPLTTLVVLQGLHLLDIPLHQMSVTGMIIALGLLIDNAIVVVDEVRHRLLSGETRAGAVSHAVRHLAVPLLGSTVTTALAFAPIALMPGGAGEFVGPIAISVVLAVGTSFLLALSITPALAAHLDRLVPSQPTDGVFARGLYSPALDAAYSRGLHFLLGRPSLAIGVALLAPTLGFIAATSLPEQFFPPADRDQFNVELELHRSASLEVTEQVARAAREVMLEHPRVERVQLFLGESGPKYYYNLVENQRGAPYFAQAMVQLDGPEDSVRVVREIQQRLDRELPQARFLARQIEQGPPFDAPVELHLYGPDLAQLRATGEDLRRILSETPDVTHANATLRGGAPKLRLDLEEEAAGLAGMDNLRVASALQSTLNGVGGGSLIEANEELDVRVRLGPNTADTVARLEDLELPTAEKWTHLSSIGELSLVPDTSSIAHRNRRRVVTTQGFLRAGTLPSRALERFLDSPGVSDRVLPRGYALEVGGESAERDEAVGNLVGSAALLLVLMAASLVLTFNSFRLAALIGAVGVSSIGLALLAVAVYGAPFGFMTIVGAMGLIGIAINDSIVVLAALRENPMARTGDLDASVKVIRRASRHVISTSLTTMAGFAPLILAGGGFWPPLAVAIAGGVAGATLIAVTLVPAAHLVIARSMVRAELHDESRRAARRAAFGARQAAP
ncbi:MAG: efflux RND transporter permease subunit [Planctomycetota bacterium]|nr:efflux RND transporter permease subunit [Planctomycetota bacterium]